MSTVKKGFGKIASKVIRHRLIIKSVFFIILVIFLTGLIGYSIKKTTPAKEASKISNVERPAVLFNNPHLSISSLNISAPVIADVDGANKTAYFKALETGVAHYKGTSKPGENGNVFIFGHSSYYFWSPGNYKEIFKNLGDIKTDDEISIWWNSKEYKYKVSETTEVDPSDVSVLEPTDSEQLTLMTCWPPGTTLRRLIVIAKPI